MKRGFLCLKIWGFSAPFLPGVRAEFGCMLIETYSKVEKAAPMLKE